MPQPCHPGKDARRLLLSSVFPFLVNPSADGQPGAQIAEHCTAFSALSLMEISACGSVSLAHDCGLLQAEPSVLTLQALAVFAGLFADALRECRPQQPLDYNQKGSSKG